MRTEKLELRHSAGPYIEVLVLYALILSFLIIMSATHDTLNKLIGPIVVLTTTFLIFISFWIFTNRRYRIIADGDALLMKSVSLLGSSKSLISIKFSDITSIKKEVSDVNTAAQLRRPFRRIAIYSEGRNSNEIDCIDVSLKHFKIGDVRKLMEEIHNRRPDLVVPSV